MSQTCQAPALQCAVRCRRRRRINSLPNEYVGGAAGGLGVIDKKTTTVHRLSDAGCISYLLPSDDCELVLQAGGAAPSCACWPWFVLAVSIAMYRSFFCFFGSSHWRRDAVSALNAAARCLKVYVSRLQSAITPALLPSRSRGLGCVFHKFKGENKREKIQRNRQ